MTSLKVKFLCLTAVILLVAISLTTWYNLKTQEAMLSKMADEHSRLLIETIRNSIITDMASGKNHRVGEIIAKIQDERAITSVRIFDESGRVQISARQQEIGDPRIIRRHAGHTGARLVRFSPDLRGPADPASGDSHGTGRIGRFRECPCERDQFR